MKHRSRHRGIAMVVVLLGLVVTITIFLSVLKLIAVQRQSVELQTRQIQAAWLAESAVERAAARLTAEASYRGETWSIPAGEFGGRDGATVVIRVEDAISKSKQRTIHVDADYPEIADQRVRQSREVTVRIP
jgi:type II secretory pathway component PulK